MATKLHSRSVPPITLPYATISRYPTQRTAYRFSNVFDLFVHRWIELFFPPYFVDISPLLNICLFSLRSCSTVYAKALFTVNFGTGIIPALPKIS